MNEEQIKFHEELSNVYKANQKDVTALSHGLHDLGKSYKGNDPIIKDYIKNIDVSANGTKDFSNAVRKSSREMFKARAATIALNVGMSVLISFLASVAINAIQAHKKALEDVVDATTDFKNEISTLDDAFGTYEKLNNILQDETSTTEELNSAKEQLLELQKNLIDTYGHEADGLDLVNGRYEKQIKLLEEMRHKNAEQYIAENRHNLDTLTDEMGKDYDFALGQINVSGVSDRFSEAAKKIFDKNDSLTFQESGYGEQYGYFTSDVKNAREEMAQIYNDFSDLRDLATSEVEVSFIDNVLDSISKQMKQWDEKYAAQLEAYETYTSYAAYGTDNFTGSDGKIISPSRVYDEYANAITEYNEAVANGTQENIDQVESKLEEAKKAVDKVLREAPGKFTEDEVTALSDGYKLLGDTIDYATGRQRELKLAIEGVANSDPSTSNYITNGGEKILLTDVQLQNIKDMKLTMGEFDSYMHSDAGQRYFTVLDNLATHYGVSIDHVLTLLAQLGIFSDYESPISEEDIELFEEYGDVIEKVINGQTDYASLTDAEKAAIDRFNVSAEKRNLLTSDYLTLNKEAQSAAFSAALAASASANDKLAEATEEAVDAMEDMDTIVATVNKKMYLTDEQMSELVSRHSDLADSLEWTEKGWTLEADAMDLAKSASTSLQSAYIAAHQKMTEMCSTATANRLKMYGVELTSMKSLASAFSKMAGRRMDISLMQTEAGQKYYDYAKSQGYTPFTAGDTTDEEKQMTQFVINQFETLQFLEDAEKQMKNLTGAIGATSGGSSVEKYLADLDELYKTLEKQKRIEEDIADIQRDREGLEEDDYSGRIKNIYKEIDALESLNLVYQEQNKIREGEISKRVAELKKYGMTVTYNAEANELLVDNYENLNVVAYAYAKATKLGAEATNELVQRMETLVTESHELNDANRETLATWKDNIQAVKDYTEEIKNLKLEMVDDYLGKKNDYISHMTDFELWDTAEVSKQLESMLEDLDDFYAADLLSYEEYVERHNEITKQLYDSRKDSLEYIMDMVEDMIRQELDDQVEAYEDQKDALNDIIEAKKKIIELTKEENDYNKSLQDKVKEMAKLQERIAQLELDDSREAAAEKATLIDQLAELQSEVDSMQYDNSIDKQLEALDEMAENNEEAIDKEIEQIEELADNAEYIHDQTIKYIRDNWSSLLDDLIEFNNLHGDGIDENVTQNWENAYSALMEYKEAAWSVAKDMTIGQAVGNTLNPQLPDAGGSAQDVIDAATAAEVSNLVSQMKSNSLKWPTAGNNRGYLESENIRIAGDISKLLGEEITRGDDGVWYLPNGEKLYEKYHTGGTVGSKKKSEVFSLLEQGEDVLNKQQKFTAIPLLQAGIQALNLNENTAKILDALQKNARPNFGALNSNEPTMQFAPEINIEVNAGSDAKEIAAATKDAVWSAITDPFQKMGVSSKLRSIKI